MKKIIILILLLILLACNNLEYKITNFEECVAAGNPVMESYPEQCMADGKTFTRELSLEEKKRSEPPEDKESEKTQIANPASVYCIEHGGNLEIRKSDAGEYGVCIFDDRSECEEWAFFRGECEEGLEKQENQLEADNFCEDKCGDGVCDEFVCQAIGCPCAETKESCPQDCE